MLDTILQTKREEIERLALPEQVEVKKVSLYDALRKPNRSLGLLAEVKKASPSKGLIRADFHPVEIGKSYEAAGADAISVLTDETYFQGHRDYLTKVKQAVNIPVLRKDFIIDRAQILESVRIGADAILLIVGTIPTTRLKELYDEAHELGLECLVEVHSEEEIAELFSAFTPTLIGVNNRNLKTFETDVAQTEKMAQVIPHGTMFLSESGLHTYDDLQRVKRAGATGVLVGESLMRASSPEEGIQHLFGGEPVATDA
ncbi:indole-3-glycerol phosphate synthase TrpC [Halalkalibacterium halodurans]|uniref:indole-3-glycerol phosphate synthase TrpC n=1 Tax=Halalkalibacterium halodurans TaxID=86665 RepID=UPI0010675486|nr:indole-3-glycerol phosphate synthase TrpC [Halalkalibacterium halodurans]MDY7222232.1 indole-3-glycerol phosphate synthase TrpC [Halalkalibacterium halodurans]MDY7241453.1 indole-3-glycerol phosphate synthase TrpC [Halalkalibacterium halodurans]MED3646085.1 indole-3-glycerol phosphate synthase TrpC [Halalkalibacterium halodurans]TES57740.1 indole-3-glycerol phosphate synthase TrpC [Halalkalibacterium halodurans]